MVVRFELKIPSLGITVRHHSTSLMMPNSYPRDGIFSPNLTTIKESYLYAYLTRLSAIFTRSEYFRLIPASGCLTSCMTSGRITVRHHSASLVMPNSYHRDVIFNPHLTTIKDSYNPGGFLFVFDFLFVLFRIPWWPSAGKGILLVLFYYMLY